MSGEQLNNKSEDMENNGDNNPWQEVMRDVLPFDSAKQQSRKTDWYSDIEQQYREQAAQAKLERQRADEREMEYLMNGPLDLDSIIDGGEKELQEKRARIERLALMGWAPEQAELADKKVANAEAEYRRAAEMWAAERAVWEGVSGYKRGHNTISFEDLIDSLNNDKQVLTTPTDEEKARGLSELSLRYAHSRIMNRLRRIDHNWQGNHKIEPNDREWLEQATRPSTTDEGMSAVTLTVGQEIPANWFESKTKGSQRETIGIKSNSAALIDGYLGDILSIEFSKISENERKNYDYAAAARALRDEALKTRRIPDVVAIIQANRKNSSNKK